MRWELRDESEPCAGAEVGCEVAEQDKATAAACRAAFGAKATPAQPIGG